MPSSRRTKQIVIAVALFVLFLVYVSRDTTTQTFYTRTVQALDAKKLSDEKAANKLRTIKDASKAGKPIGGGGDAAQKPLADSGRRDESVGDGEVSSKRKSKEDAGDRGSPDSLAQEKAPYEKSQGEAADGKSVAGRKKMKNPKSKEERVVEAELNQILKRSPVIIFSKSWCPYSAKAKRILTDKYSITPRPHVVELDQHALGNGIQNMLEKTTGRRTVPNILINGKSIGGGDDIEAAEIAGTLIEKIQTMAGKRITKLEKLREGD